MRKEPLGRLTNAEHYSDEVLFWDKEDDRKKKKKTASKITYIGNRKVQGVLTGGNLVTLNILIGTRFQPDFERKILFIEEEGGSVATYQRRLTYLQHTGILHEIAGLIVARPTGFSQEDNKNLLNILRELHSKFNIPIAAFVDAGHTTPLATLPIGIACEIDCKSKTLKILDSAVI